MNWIFVGAPSTPEWGRKLWPFIPSMADYHQALKELEYFARRTPRVIRIVNICHRARTPAVEMLAMWNRSEHGVSQEVPTALLSSIEMITKQRERRFRRFLKKWSRCVGASVGPPSDIRLDKLIRDLALLWTDASGKQPKARWNWSTGKPVGAFSRLLICVVAAFSNRPARCASDEALIKRAQRALATRPASKSSVNV